MLVERREQHMVVITILMPASTAAPKRNRLDVLDVVEVFVDNRQGLVGVDVGVAMAGEVLHTGDDPLGFESLSKRHHLLGHSRRIATRSGRR